MESKDDMTIREWFASYGYRVSEVILTHIGEAELEEPIVLYDENDTLPEE